MCEQSRTGTNQSRNGDIGEGEGRRVTVLGEKLANGV
jgi:hypothetical protein